MTNKAARCFANCIRDLRALEPQQRADRSILQAKALSGVRQRAD